MTQTNAAGPRRTRKDNHVTFLNVYIDIYLHIYIYTYIYIYIIYTHTLNMFDLSTAHTINNSISDNVFMSEMLHLVQDRYSHKGTAGSQLC